MKRLFIECNPYFVRVALAEDGELIEFGAEHVAERSHVGNIYKGKVENVLGGMKAAFVNVGLERNGFLYIGDDEVSAKVSAGDILMCQVVKETDGHQRRQALPRHLHRRICARAAARRRLQRGVQKDRKRRGTRPSRKARRCGLSAGNGVYRAFRGG